MNIVESKLYFTTPPLSIRRFNQQKNLKDAKENFDKASIYIICKREVPQIRVLEQSSIEEYLRDVDEEKYVLLNIEMRESDFKVDCAYILPDSIKKSKFISMINDTTVDEIFFCTAHNIGTLGYIDDISPLVTYEVLYVGQCVGERFTKRFKAHHALQNMLIEENVISRHYDKAEELILMPLYVDSDIISVLTPDLGEEEFTKAFTNNFDFGSKEVTLDAEKALVHNMNPKYNKIKFLNYPNSKDGLYNTDAHAFSYALAEFAMLKYNNGVVIGCSDTIYASKIVGDDEGFTKVYKPGEDMTQKYVPRIMSYMGEDVVKRFKKK